MFKNRKDIVNSISISVIILIGIFLRMRQFIYNRPLWLDELMLALNIRNRSYAELLLPLDNNQGAPVLFLWIEKCFYLLGGNKDLLLRIFPLLAGILSIFLILLVSRSFQSSSGTLLSIGLFVILPNLVYFSSEAKQYSSDVFISLLLIWMAIRSLKPSASKNTILLFGLLGFLGMWISHPSVFILAGSGITLGIECVRSKNYQKLRWLGICILLWLAGFALEFSVTLNSIRSNSNLNNYWDFAFMPLPPWKNLSWFGTTLTDYVSFMGYRDSKILFIPLSLLVVGSADVLIKRWQVGFVLLVPIILMLIGSSFEMYPVAGRLLLFAFPIAILLMVEGIEIVRVEFSKQRTWLGWAMYLVLAILVLAQPIKTSFTYLREPYIKEDMKSVLSDLRENYQRRRCHLSLLSGQGFHFGIMQTSMDLMSQTI